ncbi:hypothetical protein [Kitasatospora sp. CB01950]|uniref:hypothetical protein n=1 Tax=Kitasatospora sp. CB01950 TaxID=1703930 RepID=UPI00093CD374|nr:hypothetical protein [Kitasatospora sp. CB01950]OKJ16088.1 hypothetical protein AMK19_07960 [Kitasatospora sp. CB01950]
MKYRNLPLAVASWALIGAQPFVLVFQLMDGGGLTRPWDAVLVTTLPAAAAWSFRRIGVSPRVYTEGDRLVVVNPFVTYRVPLRSVHPVGRSRGSAIAVDGLGEVHLWAMSASVFDGRRVQDARRTVRRLAGEARAAASSTAELPRAVRTFRVEWADLLLLPVLAVAVWLLTGAQ